MQRTTPAPQQPGTGLADLGADLLQRILLHLPDVSSAAAAASFLRDAAAAQDFQIDWFLHWHGHVVPDRPWQYAAAAAWPAARMRAHADACGMRGLAGFMRSVLLRRMELGSLDASGPGSTPAEAAAAAARVQQLLQEHDTAVAKAAAANIPVDAAEARTADAAVARALLLLCPHSEHLLVPYLALGGHTAAIEAVLPLLDNLAPPVLPWLAQDQTLAHDHDIVMSAFLAAMRRGNTEAADTVMAAAIWGDAGVALAAAMAAEDGGGLHAQMVHNHASEVQLGILLELAVEYGSPDFMRNTPRLRCAWAEQTPAALVVHLGSAAARKDAGAAAMLQFILEELEARPGGAAQLTAAVADRLLGSIGSATPEMADLAVQLAARHSRERTLLRHALGSPPLARLLVPRLATASPALFAARPVAEEISHALVESADSDAALEAASLLWSTTAVDPGRRAELVTLLAARRPTGLLEWYWLHTTLGARAAPLPVNFAYWGVLQAALEHSYGVPAAAAAAAALEAGLVTSDAVGVGKDEIAEAKLQARMLEAVAAGDLEVIKQLEAEQRETRLKQQRKRAARRQRKLEAAGLGRTATGSGEPGDKEDDDDCAPQALPFGARGLLLAAAEAGRPEVVEHLLDRLHSARQLQPRDPIHGVSTSAVNREPLLPTPLLRAGSKRALPPHLAAKAAAILLEHSRDNNLLLSRWLGTYNAQLPETASHVTRILRSALTRTDADGMPSLPPGARAAEFDLVAEAAVSHYVHSLDRLAAVFDWLGRAGRATRSRRPRAAAAAALGAAGGSGGVGSDDGEGDEDEEDSGLGFDSGDDQMWLDDEEEWSGDAEEEREEDHLVSSSTEEEEDEEEEA